MEEDYGYLINDISELSYLNNNKNNQVNLNGLDSTSLENTEPDTTIDIDKLKKQKTLAEHGYETMQFAATAVPNVAMSALMSATDFFYKPLLWTAEKTSVGLGYDNMEGLYEAKKDALKGSGKEMAEFWSNTLATNQGGVSGLLDFGAAYGRNEVVTDIAGDMVNIGLGSKFLMQSVSKGSKLYNAANAVVPTAWVDNVFYDGTKVANATKKLNTTIQQLANNGFNASAEVSLAKEAGKLVKVALPEATKETVYTGVGLYASGYKREELFPEDLTLAQKATWYFGVPALLGIGVPALGAANKARVIFNRGSDKASSVMLNEVSSYMYNMGLADEIAGMKSNQYSAILGGYGLAGNEAADVAVQNAYIVKGLQALKDKAIKSIDSNKVTSEYLNEAIHYFDGLILDAEARSKTAWETLVDKAGLSKNDLDTIYSNVNKATENWSNVLQGTTKLSKGPKTQTELAQVLSKASKQTASAKGAAMANKVAKEFNPNSNESAFTTYELTPREAGAKFIQLIDEDGIVYDANDYWIRRSLESDFDDSIKAITNVKNPITNGKYTDYVTTYYDDAFNKEGIWQTVKASPDGKVTVKLGASKNDMASAAESSIGPANIVGYDLGWGVLNKQFEKLLERREITTMVKGQKKRVEKYGYEILAETNPNGFYVDLKKADHLQLGYLSRVYKTIGEENFNKLFKIKPEEIDKAKQNVAKWNNIGISEDMGFGSSLISTEDVSLGDALQQLWLEKVDEVFNKRAWENAKKANFWKFNQLTEDSIFEGVSGIKPLMSSSSKLGNQPVLDKFKYAVRNYDIREGLFNYDVFNRKPQKLVAQETSEIGGWTDTINNELMTRLAENKINRTKILAQGTELDDNTVAYFEAMGIDANEPSFVNDIFNELSDRPQYTNGWLNTPYSIAGQTGKLGKAGRFFMFKDEWQEGNIALHSAISFNNEVSPVITKAINNRLSGAVAKSKTILQDKDKITEFSKFIHQSNSGWKMANIEPVLLANGKYAFMLDEKGVVYNQNIANRQASLKQTTANAIGDYLPDPITGKTLEVSKETADLIAEYNHNAYDIWRSNTDISAAAGRQGGAFRPYWYPAKDLSKLEVRIVGHTENGVFKPDIYVTGNTVKQAEAAAKLEMKIAGFDKKSNYSIRTTEDVESSKSLIQADIDANGFQWADYTDAWQQMLSDKNDLGGIRLTQGNLILNGEDVLRNTFNGFNHQYQMLAKRTRSAMFNDEINTARSMLTHKGQDDKLYDEINMYISALRGTNFEPKTAKSTLYKAFDYIIDKGATAISDLRNLPRYARAQVIATQFDDNLRTTSKLFHSGEEVKTLYNMQGELLDHLGEAMKKLKITTPMHSKEIIGMANKAATLGLLRVANLGYAAMNIVSLPVVMPMVRKMLARRPGESVREWQARVGIFGKVVGEGEDLAIDLLGGFTSTINKAQNDMPWARRIIREGYENGVFSSQASLINEVMLDPARTITGKGGRKFFKAITTLADKSEEFSRTVPYLYAYDIAERAGLEARSCRSFATRFTNAVTGSYVASNRPALMTDALGSLIGLFYTYNLNYLQNYVSALLAGDKASAAVGLAMQTFMFGTESLPGVDEIKNYFIPTSSGKDLYSILREKGADDSTARTLMYGGLSAITGLNFAAKGEVRPNLPGMTTPPIISLTKNTVNGLYDAIKSIGANSNTNPRLLWEIAQTRLPITFAKSGINLMLGYKTNYKGDIVADKQRLGSNLWYASNLLSMQTVDETLARDAIQRDYVKRAQQQEHRTAIRRNMEAGFRSGEDAGKVIYNGVADALGTGLDPRNARQFVKSTLARAMLTPLEMKQNQLMKKQYNTESDLNMLRSIKLLGYSSQTGVTDDNVNPYGLPNR